MLYRWEWLLSLLIFDNPSKTKINASWFALATIIVAYAIWPSEFTGSAITETIAIVLSLTSILGGFFIISRLEDLFYFVPRLPFGFNFTRKIVKIIKKDFNEKHEPIYNINSVIKSPYLHNFFSNLASQLIFLVTVFTLFIFYFTKIPSQDIIVSLVFFIGLLFLVIRIFQTTQEYKALIPYVAYFYAMSADDKSRSGLKLGIYQNNH